MRRILASLALVLSLGLAAPAPAQQAEIEGVIRGQIEAFRADDFATAFTYASPAIKQLFQSPNRFGSMVRQGYPMVWRPADVTFLDLDEQGSVMVQRVLIRDQQGALHVLAYQMIPTDDGWQINGVQILQASALSA